MTPPLLRSPPFPGISPAVAAVSRERSPTEVADAIGTDALFAAIRAMRVGGRFWRPPAPLDAPAIVLAPASGGQARAMAATVAGSQRPVVMAARRAPAGLVALGDVDPWSLLVPGAHVIADAGHELAALATIAGVSLALWDGATAAASDPLDHGRAVADRLAAACYRDPFDGRRVDASAAVALLGEWRALIDANRAVAVLAGMSRWKRPAMRRFFWAPRDRRLRFAAPARAPALAARLGGAIGAWPSRVPSGFAEAAASARVPCLWIEDGFVRSVGLGSALHAPQSIAVDTRGIHYDPRTPSDLEQVLRDHPFPPALLARAAALRRVIVERRVGKYGADAGGALPPRDPARRLVLVPGQVADDESVRRSGSGVDGMLDLLARVRAMEPDAEVWFRPHPDVDRGFRAGAVADAEALRVADRVVRGGGIADLLTLADDVHVISSLAGFEALLRGCRVTVHGLPFYAGWGLTRDVLPCPRRGRRLTLDQLVAATLILYPRYLDPVTGLPCPVEVLVTRLAEQAAARPTAWTRLRAIQGRLYRMMLSPGR